jgi:large subunit ribosomal protein L25
MELGTSLHLADLKLPAGVSAVHSKDNPTIATASVPGGGKAEAVADAEAAPAPEEKK